MQLDPNSIRLLQAIDDLKCGAIQFLQELIRIPSITGNEEQAQLFFADYLRKIDLEVESLFPQKADLQKHPAFSDDGLPLGKRPVIVGLMRGANSKGRSMILNGHMDVVPTGDESMWQDGPWSGAIRDGKIFGRGSCDMKGGLIAGALALSAIRKLKIRLDGSVWLQSVIGEESGGVGTLAAVLNGYRADAAIVLEPTCMAICPVGAGAASFRIHIRGKAAHGAMRHEGVSAIEKFQIVLSALQEFEKTRHRDFHHPLYKAGTYVAPISVGKIQAGDWPSTVPELLTAEGRFGIFPGEKIETARKVFADAIQSAAKQDIWLRENPPNIEWFEGQFESAETPTDSDIITAIKTNHWQIHGKEPEVHGVTYGSDLRFFTNNAEMPAVLYGPGDVRVAHSVNEFVPIDEVVNVAKIVALTILNWCNR
jgi:acetylornithine deacetylase